MKLLERPKSALPAFAERFNEKKAREVREFHRSFPQYEVTPMRPLPSLAETLGVRSVFLKDESPRFGLNAFKVLGGTRAVGLEIAGRTGAAANYSALTSPEIRSRVKGLTFVTATDGNHGRGVAWAARELGCRSVVLMPKGSAEERLNNIRAAGADARITDVNYDDTVRMAAAMAEENGWILLQDTAREGYEEIPLRIMEGYTTMAAEAAEQMNGVIPTHVFLQCGVGSMAAAVLACLSDIWRERPPKFVVVDPEAAPCMYISAEAGERRFVTGDMKTIMAGLACGEPSTSAWEILRCGAEFFAVIDDRDAERAMHALAHPRGADPAVVSGESGCAGIACAMAAASEETVRTRLGLDRDSVLLCFSTEGATDRADWQRVTGLKPEDIVSI